MIERGRRRLALALAIVTGVASVGSMVFQVAQHEPLQPSDLSGWRHLIVWLGAAGIFALLIRSASGAGTTFVGSLPLPGTEP